MRIAVTPKWREAAIVACLFLLAAYGGSWYYLANGATPVGTGDWFGPSAMLAAGRGFVVPALSAREWVDSPETLAFREFLATKRNKLAPTDIPAKLSIAQTGAFHHIHCYLFYSVAAVWRMFGISYTALAPLLGLMTGLSVVAAYALFRLCMGRIVASICAVLFFAIPSHLAFIPNIRDYGKAPFILAALALMGYLVTQPVERKRVLLLCALLGLDIGIGLGFRFDLILMLLMAALVILGGLSCGMRKRVRLRLGALAIMLLCFAIPAWPVLRSIADEQDVEALHIMEGLAPDFGNYLGVGGVPYRMLDIYNDALAYDTAIDYAYRIRGIDHNIPYCNMECTQATRGYLVSYLRHFPADVVIRALAGTLRICQYGIIQLGLYARPLPQGYTESVLPWLLPLLLHVRAMGPWYVGAMLLLVASRHLRFGLIALFFVLYLGAYSSLQFDPRHTFHLAFLPVMGLGVVVEQGVLLARAITKSGARTVLKEGWHHRDWINPLSRTATFVGVAACLTLMPLFATRWYQGRHVGELYRQYRQAERAPLSITQQKSVSPGTSLNLYQPPDLFASAEADNRCLHSAYLVAELTGNSPQVSALPYYRTETDFNNYGTPFQPVDLTGTSDAAPLHLFFPVFGACPSDTWGRRDFVGLCLSAFPDVHLLSMSRVVDPSALPFLLTLTLAPNWETAPHCQTLQPVPIPNYVGKEIVTRGNILINGGFEEWQADNVPAGFNGTTRTSVISRSARDIAQGRYAMRQTWQEADVAHPIPELFYAGIGNLKPNTRYGFGAKALNLSAKGIARVSIWQLKEEPGQSAIPICIAPSLIKVEPGEGFQDLYGTFKTLSGDSTSIFIVTYTSDSVPRDAFPVTVIWDDWRLAPLPE